MAYDESKLTKLAALKSLAQRTKAQTDALGTRVTALENAGGEPNVLEGVKVNGAALTIAQKMVDILITTGSANGTISVNGVDVSIYGLAALAYKSEISQADLDTALATVIANKANSSTTLTGYGITDAYTKTEIDGIVSSVYKPAGSVAFASLPTLSEDVLGNVYNVTDAFTTDSDFVEGAGNDYPAGTNVVVVNTGTSSSPVYKFDVLAGFVDLSGYVTSASIADERTKLAGIATGATKVEASQTNGNIKINDVETTVYTLPTTTAVAAGFNKVGKDVNGFAVIGDAVAASDLEALLDAENSNAGYYCKVSNVATDAEVAEMLTEVFGA